MNNIQSIAFALDPNNTPSFLLDWEVTKLCNLDCSYCSTGLEGGHDNTTQHPPLDECLRTIDFMFEYVDLYMQHKKPSQRKVVLNVYGGESLFHPDIVEILQACRDRHAQYQNKWYLTICCTTNAIVGERQWHTIVPLIDNFTLSYHSEVVAKQKSIFKKNALHLKEINKPFRVAMVMHNREQFWQECIGMIDWFKQHNINFTPKPLDNDESEWNYTKEQFGTLKTFWMTQVLSAQKLEYKKLIDVTDSDQNISSIDTGRPCCGGRKLSINGNLKSSVKYVPHQGFRGWSCSVNWFFLFVRQLDGAVYTNKDCKVSTSGRVEPLGYLHKSTEIIDQLKRQFEHGMPIIKCVKDLCKCGFCAPKAETEKEFLELVKRNVPVDIFQKTC
jgi:pyruvate-formate lyase-activating enzyme